MSELRDGEYEVVVIDVESVDATTSRVDVVLVTGARKGDVMSVLARNLTTSPLDLMGLPATLRVIDGAPRLDLS